MSEATAAAGREGPRVILALDFPQAADALALASRLDPEGCALKVGKELFTSAGPDVIRELERRGFRVFLDLKYHDIPNTAAQACAAATRLGVWMLNVHAAGGSAMLDASRKAVDEAAHAAGRRPPLLIGVTVLTSLDATALAETGVNDAPDAQVMRLARLAQAHGLDGVVCSAREAPALRAACGSRFVLVTPGIRPAGSSAADQSRIETPEAALASGSDYLVIGRPVTRAADPQAALAAINLSIGMRP